MKRMTKKQTANRRLRAILIAAFVLMGALFGLFFGLRHHVVVQAEGDPVQTRNIRSAEDLIEYSRTYAAGGGNPKDVLNISINTGSVVSDDGFISLGTAERPFAGTINIPAAGVDTFHLFDCPLFN